MPKPIELHYWYGA